MCPYPRCEGQTSFETASWTGSPLTNLYMLNIQNKVMFTNNSAVWLHFKGKNVRRITPNRCKTTDGSAPKIPSIQHPAIFPFAQRSRGGQVYITGRRQNQNGD